MKKIISKSLKTKRQSKSYGDDVSWQDMELTDMTETIKTDRTEEKLDVARIKQLESKLKELKDEVSWEEARCLTLIKGAPAELKRDPEALTAIKSAIQISKNKIKELKFKYDVVYEELHGKPFYAVSGSKPRVVVSTSLRKKSK